MFVATTPIKASRKRRRCDWCGEWIEIGEPAVKAAGIYEGDFTWSKFHTECAAAWETWHDEYDPHSFVRGTTNQKS